MRDEMEQIAITENVLVAGFKEWRQKLKPRRLLVVDAIPLIRAPFGASTILELPGVMCYNTSCKTMERAQAWANGPRLNVRLV